MIWVGEKGRDIYNTWNLTDEERKLLATYYAKFEDYVKPKSNNVFARYKFHKRIQQDNESFEQFLTDLRLLVKDCGYADPDEMVRDRVVIGCQSQKTREKLIQEGSDLTLEKAIDIARMQVMSTQQLETMAGEDPKVHHLKAKFHKKETYSRKPQNQPQPRKHAPCTKCGLEHNKDHCPAQGKTCSKCNKPNHFARVCRSKGTMPRKVHYVQDNSSDDDQLFVGSVETVHAVDMNEWHESLKIRNKLVKVQLDTGARCNVISLKTLQSLGTKLEVKKPEAKLKSYSGHMIKTRGVTTLPCEHKGQQYEVKFHVVDIDAPPVLSAQTCKELGLVKRIHAVTCQSPTPEPCDILKQYPDLFDGLGCLPKEHTIKVDSSVPPVVHPPRRVPFALKERITEELKRMEVAGVIVKETGPTDWVSSMVTVVKPNKIRICIDPRDLNKAIKREHYPMKTIEEVVAEMPGATVFSVLDATSGYWQVKLDEASSKLCTFNSPFGRYRFTRLPFGIKSAPEVFQQQMSQIFEDIDGVQVIVDDILVWGRDVTEHDARMKQVLDHAREVNLKLNRKKCQVRKAEVPYVGHLLTKDGLKPDPEKIRAVEAMEQPQNTKELRTFLGFIQYIGKFMPNLSQVTAPLRKLLDAEISWHWEGEQEESFQKLKAMASCAPVLGYYDPQKPVTLSVDASSKGLGAVLIQDGKPVVYASRALTPTQVNYAQIEKETLAIVYATQKFHQYIYGKSVAIESDHKPLENILKKPLHQAPLRLQKMLLTLQRYDLRVAYKPGKELLIADALSRSFLKETKETLVPDLEVNEITLTAHLPMSPEKYEEMKKATAEDPVLTALQDAVLDGWPDNKANIPVDIRVYWSSKDEISCVDGLLFKGHKLIVPSTLRLQMLEIIHESHQGIVKCKQRARDVLYWPGMAKQIEDKVAKCAVCSQYQKAYPKEPMVISQIPDRPWSKIGTDHLVCVDYYSKWIELDKLDNLSSKNTICYLKSQFSRYGIPDELVSDNGPQYACAEFEEFAKKYGFCHTTSSPRYPQSNGEAERAVQTATDMIKEANDPYKALLNYRNTPLEEINLSPAQLMMGRRLKSTLPTTAPLLRPQGSDKVKDILKKRKETQKFYYDQRSGKELPSLQTGDTVRMQHGDKWIPARVSYKHSSPRSYVVETSNGRKYRRNRRYLHLSRAPETMPPVPRETTHLTPEHPSSLPSMTPNSVGTEKNVAKQLPTTKPDQTAALQEPDTQSVRAPTPRSEPSKQTTRSGRTVKLPGYLKDFEQ